MNYKPQCDSCKYFVTTDKPIVRRKKYKSRFDWLYAETGRCTLGYCKKEKQQIYRKNMR